MTAIAVAAAEIGVWEQALVASTVDTVTFTRDPDSVVDEVRVTNVSGTASIYFTTDGTAPTVGGKATRWLPAVAGANRTVRLQEPASTVVKLISSGTPTYSVEAS